MLPQYFKGSSRRFEFLNQRTSRSALQVLDIQKVNSILPLKNRLIQDHTHIGKKILEPIEAAELLSIVSTLSVK